MRRSKAQSISDRLSCDRIFMVVCCRKHSLHISQSASRTRVDKLWSWGQIQPATCFVWFVAKNEFYVSNFKWLIKSKGQREFIWNSKIGAHKYSLIGILSHSFIYMLSMAAFALKSEFNSCKRGWMAGKAQRFYTLFRYSKRLPTLVLKQSFHSCPTVCF